VGLRASKGKPVELASLLAASRQGRPCEIRAAVGSETGGVPWLVARLLQRGGIGF
jgi:hypothetical protein